MWSRPQYTDLTYTGGTGPCGPMSIIFGSVSKSQYTSLNIAFGVTRTFHVVTTPVYRFDLYGRYRTLWTDEDNFQWCYLQLVYKSKYKIQCESDVACTQDPYLPLGLLLEVADPMGDDDNFQQCYLELVYKPKYQIWCNSDVPGDQDPSLPI